MANTLEGESGWSGLLIDLVRNFLLLRDIFGYLLPGMVFLFLGMLSGRFLIPDWMAILDLSFWERVIVFLIMALVAGHILVAISYLPANLGQLWGARKKLAESPTELSGYEIEGRARFPGLFVEYDRRTTQSIMVSGLAIAFLLTALMVYWPGLRLRYIVLAAGAVLFLNMYTGRRHLARVHAALLASIEKFEKRPGASKTPPAGS
jgi:succinate dehydrogenase/fumarate reductase cytochrome b subunit